MYGPDHRFRVETPDAVVESVVVAGDAYLVRDGTCRMYPGAAARTGADGAASAAAEGAADPALTRTGTDTVAGVETAVLELPAGELEGIDATLTYYVALDSNRIRRVAGGVGTVTYSDWGQVDPIRPPDRDCRPVE